MSTPKQIAANRRNATKSSGPRTVQGKAVSRMNALQFGLEARSTIIRGESESELRATMDALFAEHQPVTPTEQGIVTLLGHSLWRLHRLLRVEGQLWEAALLQSREHCDFEAVPLGIAYGTTTQFPRFERHLTSVRRAIHQCLDELRRLRAERPVVEEPDPDADPLPQPIEIPTTSTEIGFVPPNRESPQIGFVPSNPAPALSPQIGFVPSNLAPAPPPQIGFVPSNWAQSLPRPQNGFVPPIPARPFPQIGFVPSNSPRVSAPTTIKVSTLPRAELRSRP